MQRKAKEREGTANLRPHSALCSHRCLAEQTLCPGQLSARHVLCFCSEILKEPDPPLTPPTLEESQAQPEGVHRDREPGI